VATDRYSVVVDCISCIILSIALGLISNDSECIVWLSVYFSLTVDSCCSSKEDISLSSLTYLCLGSCTGAEELDLNVTVFSERHFLFPHPLQRLF